MAALKVVVLLAVIGSSSLALPFSEEALSRMKRQAPSPQCQADFFALSSDACFSLFGEGTDVTVENAKQFCEDGCSDKLKSLFNKLIADCGSFAGVSANLFAGLIAFVWVLTSAHRACMHAL